MPSEERLSKLELKLPPVLLTIIFATFMWLVSLALPGISSPGIFKFLAFAALASIGAFFSISGVMSFRKADTSVNPIKLDAPSSLVTSGVYKSTRNPMYVGFLFFLISWGFLLSNLFSLALCVVFVLYMNRFQVEPEERVLESIFGAEFLTYKNRVRRWL